MANKWGQGTDPTVVHRILSERANNGNGMQVELIASYICMASHPKVIARKAKSSIFMHGEAVMVDPHKLIITTGVFHVS
jgi:hypothetical protein